ncbi:MAG: hypothetical protein ACXWFH_06880 [Solirubrobacterales bacterium]
MDAVTILREIWRCRVPVGLAAVVAILVGLVLTYTVSLPPKSRKYDVGIASSRILVDTPSSQVVNVEPRGLETLGVRASVLANVMTEGEIKTIIATDAGLDPSELGAGVEFEGALPADLSRAAGDPEAHVLTARTATDPDGVPLPIIEIEAQAPDSAAAVRLADAAVAGLGGYLASKAANESVPNARRLQVTGLGAPQVRQEIRGPKRVVALGLAVFVFLCGCAGILVLSALAPGWRLSTLAPGRRLSTLARGWLAKLAPERGRADAASKPTDDADASGAANTGERAGGGSGRDANGGGKDGSAVAGKNGAHGRDNAAEKRGPGQDAENPARGHGPQGNRHALGKKGKPSQPRAHGRDNAAEKCGPGQDAENQAREQGRGNGAEGNGRAPGKKGAAPRHSAPNKSGQGKRKNPNRRRRTARR